MQGSLENSGLPLFLLDDFTIKKIEEHTESVMIANRLFYKSLRSRNCMDIMLDIQQFAAQSRQTR